MDTTADTLVADLADQGINPAEAPHNCALEVDTAERFAIVRWTEELQFHAEYNGARTTERDGWDEPDQWAPLVDEGGWLSGANEEKVRERLAAILADVTGERIDVDTIEYGGDEPNVTFEVVTTYRDGETYGEWLDRIGWPVVATLINVTDPGTFNSPYLFGRSTFGTS